MKCLGNFKLKFFRGEANTQGFAILELTVFEKYMNPLLSSFFPILYANFCVEKYEVSDDTNDKSTNATGVRRRHDRFGVEISQTKARYERP